MKKKLSKKERNETVTKGYLEDQDFVTKDWAMEMFEKFEKRITEEFRNHTGALMEFHAHQNQLVIDALLHRIERIEHHVGLSSI